MKHNKNECCELVATRSSYSDSLCNSRLFYADDNYNDDNDDDDDDDDDVRMCGWEQVGRQQVT